jgi:hypothetical protein
VSAPGSIAGELDVRGQSRLWGAEANFIRNVIYDCECTINLLVGFRYIDLDENLSLTQTSTFLTSQQQAFAGATYAVNPGNTLSLADRFVTRNNLFAGQVGTQIAWRKGPLTYDVFGKVAMGPNVQQIQIDGSSQLTTATLGTITAPGGLLALNGANSGRSSTGWFTIAPEVGGQVGWQITRNVKIAAGYNLLYINSVVRPGDQINTRVNPSFVPASTTFGNPSAPAEPTRTFRRTDYWAHGVTGGVEFRY